VTDRQDLQADADVGRSRCGRDAESTSNAIPGGVESLRAEGVNVYGIVCSIRTRSKEGCGGARDESFQDVESDF
jgi:hypothetical protein